jgi:ankyrin repeat protein
MSRAESFWSCSRHAFTQSSGALLLVDADSCLVRRAFGPARGTPLHRAVVLCSRADVVKLLIRSGADADNTTLTGETPLMLSKDAAVSLVLLNAGAAVNAGCSLGCTVLHTVVQKGASVGVICCLLKAGADATAIDTVGSTAAEVALAFGHSSSAALLQRAEADRRSMVSHSTAALLPDELQISKRSRGWRRSTDIPQRRETLLKLIKEHHVSFAQPHQLEIALYRTAISLEEYFDVSKLDSLRDIEVGCSDIHSEQRAVHDISGTDSNVRSAAVSAAATQAASATLQSHDEAAAQQQQQLQQQQQPVKVDVSPSAGVDLSSKEQRERALQPVSEAVSDTAIPLLQEFISRGNDSSTSSSSNCSSSGSSSTTSNSVAAATATAASAAAATSAMAADASLAAYDADAAAAANTASSKSYQLNDSLHSGVTAEAGAATSDSATTAATVSSSKRKKSKKSKKSAIHSTDTSNMQSQQQQQQQQVLVQKPPRQMYAELAA